MRRLICGIMTLSLLAAVAMLPGCGEPSGASAAVTSGPRKITFNVVNQTGGEMKSIGVRGADAAMGFRDLDKGQTGTLSHTEPHVPEWLEVNWSDERGNRFSGKVQVWTQLGQSYGGELTLVVNRKHKVTLRGD